MPNISFGPCVISSLRKHSGMFFDAHLMVSEPIRYLDDYKKAGADGITVHIEACSDVRKTLKKIRELGLKVGLAIKPATPVSEILPYLDMIDTVLVMTVEPGFGGQKLIPETVAKIKEIKEIISKNGLQIEIEADGGITPDNVLSLIENGLDIAVAGSAIFKAEAPDTVIAMMRG